MKITDIKMMDPLYVPMAPEQDAINVVIHTVSRVTFLQVFTDKGHRHQSFPWQSGFESGDARRLVETLPGGRGPARHGADLGQDVLDHSAKRQTGRGD